MSEATHPPETDLPRYGLFTSPLMVVQAAIASIHENYQAFENNNPRPTKEAWAQLAKLLSDGAVDAEQHLKNGPLETLRNYELDYQQMAANNQKLRADFGEATGAKAMLMVLHRELTKHNIYSTILGEGRLATVQSMLSDGGTDAYRAFVDNYLTYGTGGANAYEAQFIDRLAIADQEKGEALLKAEEAIQESEMLRKQLSELEVGVQVVRAEALTQANDLAIARSREAAAVSEAAIARDALTYRDQLMADTLRSEPESNEAATWFERMMRCLSRYRVLYATTRQRLFEADNNVRKLSALSMASKEGHEAAIGGLTMDACPYARRDESAECMVAWSRAFSQTRQAILAEASNTALLVVARYLNHEDIETLPAAIELFFNTKAGT